MIKMRLSTKHLQINKANTVITATLAIAAFVTVSSLVASRAMLLQRSYQGRVIKDKELAAKTLKQNVEAVNNLQNSYKEFVGRSVNIIGSSSEGTGDRDGDNAKIILDSLPSKYDFPAIATSLEKILAKNSYKVNGITGTDDEVAQRAKDSNKPEVVEIPFTFSVSANYDSLNDLIKILESSIRPIQIKSVEFNVSGSDTQMNIIAKTYYQSEKKLNITTKVVK